MSEAAVFDALARTLADAHQRFGESAFTNRRRLIGLLADHVPEAKREIRAVGSALDEGVPARLGGSERHLVGMEIDRLAERLESSIGLRLDIARPVVRAFAFALGRGPLPSVYVASTPVPAPTPTPVAQGDWAGVSEPGGGSYQPQGFQGPNPPPAPVSQPEASNTFTIAGKTYPKPVVYLTIAGIAAAVGLTTWLDGGDNPGPGPTSTPVISSTPNGPTPTPPPAPPPSSSGATTGTADTGYAEETRDFGVSAKSTLETEVANPTPLQIPAGRRVTTGEVQRIMAADPDTVLIDVLDNPHSVTIRGAKFIPGIGSGGDTNDAIQAATVRTLATASGNDRTRKLIFFCMGARCWESYNAVLRAAAAGYSNIYWYRGGLASWQEAGLPMGETPAAIR